MKRASLEWSVTNLGSSGASNRCYYDEESDKLVHLDSDSISYHPFLLSVLRAGAYAMEKLPSPSEICSLLLKIHVRIEDISASDA